MDKVCDNHKKNLRAEEIVLENKLDYVLLTLLVTNEPTMNDIPKELKKLTIITATVALAEALDRRGRGCGNDGVEVWWTRRLWLWHICGNSLPPLFVLWKNCPHTLF